MGSFFSRPHRSPPPGAWDSHVHVVDEERFPLHPRHPYRPRKATVSDLGAFHSKLGIVHSCIVAVSVYHTDSSSILDALSTLNNTGGRVSRAVVCIEPAETSQEELHALHDCGVRGIRLNLRTRRDKLDVDALRVAAACIKPFGWVLQLYIALEQVPELAPFVDELGVIVVLDHLAGPEPSGIPARKQKGYAELMALLRSGNIYTKLSGTYRFAELPDLDAYVTDILKMAPDRVVWASDWPHTGGVEANPGGDRTKVQEYRLVDDQDWVDRCWSWCEAADETGNGGHELARKIWVDNPARLWK